MGRRANPVIIGAFVLGAIALVVLALVMFGSGRFFRHTEDFVCNFRGSVNGLVKGAPVKFRGVQIGEVMAIRLALPTEQRDREPYIPVFIAIDPEEMAALGATETHYDETSLKVAIERGLRAQLQLQSIITGVLFVGLDVIPGSPVELLAPAGTAREIPTLPTQFERLQEKLQEIVDRLSRIDYEGFGRSMQQAVDGINRLVNSPDLNASLTTLREALEGARGLVAEARQRLGPLATSVQGTGESAQVTLRRLDKTLDEIQGLIAPDAPLAWELTRTITDLGEAARAVRALADYLERNPRSILTGKTAE
jgi:paraquat-inducible protein B